MLRNFLSMPRFRNSSKAIDLEYAGSTALYESVRCGNRKAFEMLLDEGASPTNLLSNSSGLMHAAAEAN